MNKISNQEKLRINKFLSKYGYCSRRVADDLIRKNKVFINDSIATLGSLVNYSDKIYIKENSSLKEIKNQVDFIYLALNKPLGITSTTCKKTNQT